VHDVDPLVHDFVAPELEQADGIHPRRAVVPRRALAGVVLRSPFTELADVGAHHYPWLPVRMLLFDPAP
jgi:hypothetical protein